MDKKEIAKRLEDFLEVVEFLSMEEKVTVVNTIQNSVPDWGQAVVEELKRVLGMD